MPASLPYDKHIVKLYYNLTGGPFGGRIQGMSELQGTAQAPLLNRQTLASQLAQRLKERILTGIYKTDSALPSEKTLAEEFEVSRPVVREAIRELSGAGFVSLTDNVGAVVRPTDPKILHQFFTRALHFDSSSWQEIMTVRSVLEAKSVALATRNRTDEDIEVLKDILVDMNRSIDTIDEFSRLDVRFHWEIGRMSGNRLILYLISAIQEALIVMIKSLRRQLPPESFRLMSTLHQSVVEAIESGDEDEAVAAMNTHFEESLGRLNRYIENGANPADTTDPDAVG